MAMMAALRLNTNVVSHEYDAVTPTQAKPREFALYEAFASQQQQQQQRYPSYQTHSAPAVQYQQSYAGLYNAAYAPKSAPIHHHQQQQQPYPAQFTLRPPHAQLQPVYQAYQPQHQPHEFGFSSASDTASTTSAASTTGPQTPPSSSGSGSSPLPVHHPIPIAPLALAPSTLPQHFHHPDHLAQQHSLALDLDQLAASYQNTSDLYTSINNNNSNAFYGLGNDDNVYAQNLAGSDSNNVASIYAQQQQQTTPMAFQQPQFQAQGHSPVPSLAGVSTGLTSGINPFVAGPVSEQQQYTIYHSASSAPSSPETTGSNAHGCGGGYSSDESTHTTASRLSTASIKSGHSGKSNGSGNGKVRSGRRGSSAASALEEHCGGSGIGGGREKRFVCSYPGCTRAFSRNFNLSTHYNTHLGIKPFQCPSCPKSFSRRHDCARHVAAVHAPAGTAGPTNEHIQGSNGVSSCASNCPCPQHSAEQSPVNSAAAASVAGNNAFDQADIDAFMGQNAGQLAFVKLEDYENYM